MSKINEACSFNKAVQKARGLLYEMKSKKGSIGLLTWGDIDELLCCFQFPDRAIFFQCQKCGELFPSGLRHSCWNEPAPEKDRVADGRFVCEKCGHSTILSVPIGAPASPDDKYRRMWERFNLVVRSNGYGDLIDTMASIEREESQRKDGAA